MVNINLFYVICLKAGDDECVSKRTQQNYTKKMTYANTYAIPFLPLRLSTFSFSVR